MLEGYPPLLQTLLGTGLTWAVTALGAACCILHSGRKQSEDKLLFLDASLGFSAGVMLASSFWSLLVPAISIATNDLHMGALSVVPAIVGLILGSAFVATASHFLPVEWFASLKDQNTASVNGLPAVYHTPSPSPADTSDNENSSSVRFRGTVHGTATITNAELSSVPDGIPKERKLSMTNRLWMLIIAVTVHNIPEGMAIGIAFGGLGYFSESTFENARNLAVGVAIQNFPEGLAVSLPLQSAGYGFWTSFWFGQLSGLVEPVAGVLGCLAAQFLRKLQPYALGFAAGAMIFVVLDDVIPEAQNRGNGRLASICGIGGFIVMMVMDIVTHAD
ncbi:unnamed protein product [Dicrocoelium dendriticum]|nr:unnamed protein product [Dicrocoelium dendriticum]